MNTLEECYIYNEKKNYNQINNEVQFWILFWFDHIGWHQLKTLICVTLYWLGMEPFSIQLPVIWATLQHHVYTTGM
jgi:hypothetical protein